MNAEEVKFLDSKMEELEDMVRYLRTRISNASKNKNSEVDSINIRIELEKIKNFISDIYDSDIDVA